LILLIAEDNARMRESIKRYLHSRIPDHHTVLEAEDGGQAIECYERMHPDWVLMDIAMEPVDGLAASRAILGAHPEAKIIILTNYDEARYRAAAREIGTKAFILKEHLGDILPLLSSNVVRDPT
jgi:two-component system, NarL family, response regulator LiaR